MQYLEFAIINLIFLVVSADWVEITQEKQQQTHFNKTEIKKLQTSNAFVFFKKETTTITTPSPQWLEYQRERFAQNKQNSTVQKLVISSGQNLKTTAKIVVPAKTPSSTPKPTFKPKNQVFQTKTHINVLNNRPDSELMEIPQRVSVETTSRREMSYGGTEDLMSDIDSSEAEEAEIVSEGDEVEEEEENDTTTQQNMQNNQENQLQFPSIQGFLKFLKTIQSNWLKKSGFDIEHKIKLLKKLRDNLMRVIERQFAVLWQPNEQRKRAKRGILDESTLNFPPEAALLSLNFLTFAVFLIKLVLQVVNIVKSKHYSFTALNMNAEPMGKNSLRH